MSWDRWHHDPREGEHPEPQDLCPHGVDQHEAGCGACLEDEYMPATCLHGLTVDRYCAECAVAAMSAMTDEMLRRLG